MNIAIVGSREFNDSRPIFRAIMRLKELHPDLTIVSGGARGADTMGETIAKNFGIPTIVHLPDWDYFGKRAGFERNALIVRDADMVLAFFAPGPRTPGTSHTVAAAKIAGKTVHVYHEGVWS